MIRFVLFVLCFITSDTKPLDGNKKRRENDMFTKTERFTNSQPEVEEHFSLKTKTDTTKEQSIHNRKGHLINLKEKGTLDKKQHSLNNRIDVNSKSGTSTAVKEKHEQRIQTGGMSMDNINKLTYDSKIDKLLNMMSSQWDVFKWENSMLTEIAQTLSYMFNELRLQEKRIKRLNRNVKNSLTILLDGMDVDQILKRKAKG